MTSVVVAMTLVSEARSKIVSSAVTGASASKRSRPNACRHSGPVASPSSITAAGKLFCATARSSRLAAVLNLLNRTS